MSDNRIIHEQRLPNGEIRYAEPIKIDYKDNPDGSVTVMLSQEWFRNEISFNKTNGNDTK